MALPLPGGLDPDLARQQKFDALALAMPGFGGKSVEVRFGTATVTFTASNLSAALTVTHGLGRVPVVVVASENGSSTGSLAIVNSPTTTTFSLKGGCAFTTFTGTATFSWIVIG